MEESIAIVILNYCNYSLTEDCVNNLINLGIKSKIVIVDNNSNNNSYEYLIEAFKNNQQIEVIKTIKNCGYAAGNNYGIRYIAKEYKDIRYISIMNPDVVITYKNLFVNLVTKLEKYDDLAVISPMTIWKDRMNMESIYWSIPTKSELVFENFNVTSSFFSRKNKKRLPLCPDKYGTAFVEVVPGSFFIIKKEIFEEIDMFDESTFLYNEENILAIKLKRKGYKEAISINDFYVHNHNPSVGQKTLRQWYKLSNTRYRSRKHLCDEYYNSKVLSILLSIIEGLNYFELTFRYAGSRVKRKLKKIK